MDNIAIGLSIFSTIVALVSAYLSQFKKGKILIPPIRAYRIEPLNFNDEGESYRAFRLYLTLTFMNTGALPKALSDLRIRVRVPEEKKDVICDWENECPSLSARFEDMEFAVQPTLGAYESKSCIYTFISKYKVDTGKAVMKIEELGDKDENHGFTALLELRTKSNQWEILQKFTVHHSGRHRQERDFDKINTI